MDLDRLGDLITDLEDRVQSVHCALEYDRDSFPSDLPDLIIIHFYEVVTVEKDPAFSDSTGGG